VFPHLDSLAKMHPEQKVLTPRSRRMVSEVVQEQENGWNMSKVLQEGVISQRVKSCGIRCDSPVWSQGNSCGACLSAAVE
jgi:hypothetical protein